MNIYIFCTEYSFTRQIHREREIYVYAYAYNHWPTHYYIHLVVLTIATEWTDDWEIWLQGAHIDLVIWDGPVSPPWNCHELSTFFFLHPQAQDQMLSVCFLCVSSWQPIYRPSFCTRLGQFKMNEMVFCWGKTIVFFLSHPKNKFGNACWCHKSHASFSQLWDSATSIREVLVRLNSRWKHCPPLEASNGSRVASKACANVATDMLP